MKKITFLQQKYDYIISVIVTYYYFHTNTEGHIMNRFYAIICTTVLLSIVPVFTFSADDNGLNLHGNRYIAFVKINDSGDLDKRGEHRLPYYLMLGHFPDTGAIFGTLVKTEFSVENGQTNPFALNSYFIANSSISGNKKIKFDLKLFDEVVAKKIRVKIIDGGKTLKTKLKNAVGKKVPVVFELLENDTKGIYFGAATQTTPVSPAGTVYVAAGINYAKELPVQDPQDVTFCATTYMNKQLESVYGTLTKTMTKNFYSFHNINGSGALEFKDAGGPFRVDLDVVSFASNSSVKGSLYPMGNENHNKPEVKVKSVKWVKNSKGVWVVQVKLWKLKNISEGFICTLLDAGLTWTPDTSPTNNFSFHWDKNKKEITATFDLTDYTYKKGGIIILHGKNHNKALGVDFTIPEKPKS